MGSKSWNVLTIDIDSIIKDMKKITESNDTDLTPKQSWQVVRWKTGINNFEIDRDCLAFTLSLIKNFCKNAIIETIEEHDDMIKMYEKYNITKSNTWNWDFHHDISYKLNLEKLNISNWVLHARSKGYIKNYSWLRHDDSEFPSNYYMQYEQCCYKDLKSNVVPQFDLVVICKSKHFTPPEYWKFTNLLYEYALKNRAYGKFVEIPRYKIPKIDLEKFPHFIDNSQSDRVFVYDNFYMCLDMDNGIPFISYINFGETKNFFKGEANELLEYIINTYGKIGFCWTLKGTGTWLKRLSRKYKYKKEFTKSNINYMILSNNVM